MKFEKSLLLFALLAMISLSSLASEPDKNSIDLKYYLKKLLIRESNPKFTPKISGQTWLAFWQSKGGLDQLGAELSYKINPSVLYGLSMTTSYGRSVIGFDFIYGKMEGKIQGPVNNPYKNNLIYKRLKGFIRNKVTEIWDFNISIMMGNFEGGLNIDNGRYFNLNNNTWLDMKSRFITADVMAVAEMPGLGLASIGYRYMNYTKPQAFVKFHGTKDENGNILADSLISGVIEDTDLKSHYLLISWDFEDKTIEKKIKPFFGFSFGGGQMNLKGKTQKLMDRMGYTCDFTGGYFYNYPFYKNAKVNLKLGYRFMLNESPGCKQVGEDEHGKIYLGSIVRERWHGPFVSLAIYL